MKKSESKKLDISWKLYSLIIFTALGLFVIGFTYATDTNAPRTFGHTAGELYVTVPGVASEMTLQEAITNGFLISSDDGGNDISTDQVDGIEEYAGGSSITGTVCSDGDLYFEYSDGSVGELSEDCVTDCEDGVCYECYHYNEASGYQWSTGHTYDRLYVQWDGTYIVKQYYADMSTTEVPDGYYTYVRGDLDWRNTAADPDVYYYEICRARTDALS